MPDDQIIEYCGIYGCILKSRMHLMGNAKIVHLIELLIKLKCTMRDFKRVKAIRIKLSFAGSEKLCHSKALLYFIFDYPVHFT